MMDPTQCKLLMVGAGGIGCELLKNLVLTGFTNIDVIDLDTIELSNLNRQFLFQKCHVGKPKATTAKESVLKYNPNANIQAYHDSIMNPKYNVDYFKQFNLVLNALDNKKARSHVNRLCLAADVPLIESGSAGYLGQVTLIRKGVTECYDCLPKPAAKTFPGCTIRNTPSEPIHCIVWAKHLFNQLFGAEDPDEAVSPDGEDPENMADAGKTAAGKAENEEAVERVSTRTWAKETNYNPEKLFNKLFGDDVKYLLSMAKLWEQRKPPSPLNWETCMNDTTPLDQYVQANSESTANSSSTKDEDPNKLESHKVLAMQKYCELFRDAVSKLRARLEESNADEPQILVWDKDDQDAMDFVTCASNFRCHIFSITPKTQFEIKSLAGNIIPAIATTNAIVAGLIVIQALKVLEKNEATCKTAYVREKPSANNKVIVGTELVKPNEKCYVCAEKPEIRVKLNTTTMTVKQFETKILKQELHMVQPDVEIEGSGSIIISSEPGETEENNDKFLSAFGITNQSVLKCDDFFQNYELKIVLFQCDKFDEENTKEYEIVSENQMLKDMQADLKTEKPETKAEDGSKPVASPDDKKRTYDSAFEGVSETGSGETKKPRRSDQAELEADNIFPNEAEVVEQENESNSINDASDALSEEDEHIVHPKSSSGSHHRQRPPRETVIDDDIIIEENSNDFKTEEEMSNQMTENSNTWNSNSIQNNFAQEQSPPSSSGSGSGSGSSIIECSSNGSDIIEIQESNQMESGESEQFNEESNGDSNADFNADDGSNSNSNLFNGNSHTNGNHINGAACENGSAAAENGHTDKTAAYQMNNGSIEKKCSQQGNSEDDCITLIE